MMDRTENLIIGQLREGNEDAYKFLYDHHYWVLCHVADQYVHDHFLAETIVGDVIFHIWEVRASLHIETSLRCYLIRSVRNRCMDYLKSQYHQRERSESALGIVSDSVTQYLQGEGTPLGRLLEKELEGEIKRAIERLPAECKRVFKLSRFGGKKQNEIAAELGISVNTVKYHMKNALHLIHSDLHKYLIGVLFLLFQS